MRVHCSDGVHMDHQSGAYPTVTMVTLDLIHPLYTSSVALMFDKCSVFK